VGEGPRKPLPWPTPRPYRRGMFLIFGSTLRDRVLDTVRFVCTFCGVDAPQQIVESATKLSIFFIPLVTLGRRHAVFCTNCGEGTPLTREQARHGLEWAARHREVR